MLSPTGRLLLPDGAADSIALRWPDSARFRSRIAHVRFASTSILLWNAWRSGSEAEKTGTARNLAEYWMNRELMNERARGSSES
jgi:hypothetical protein